MEHSPVFIGLLKEVIERRASDLHIRSEGRPRLRILGQLDQSRSGVRMTSQEVQDLVSSLMNDRQKKIFSERLEVDLAFSVPEFGRFRVNIYQQRGLLDIAVRAVPADIPTVEDLQLPPVVRKLAESRRGLILVTGTTGSGKSTTLASMVDAINAARSCHIVTIEDPIEFLHADKKAIVSQRELGQDTLTYAEALKHVVRQDPDVILVGEMRDLETVAAALTAAQTGHLVLSTLHTTDTIQSVSRVVDLFPPHQQEQIRFQLADTLQGIVSQRLIRRADGSARVPAVEVLVATPLIRKAIQENNMTDIGPAMKQGQFYGMQTFNQALLKLHNESKISLEEAQAAASNPEEILLALRGIESGGDANKFYVPS
ncbi:MAG TPA: type IV pilus twitching motility protein PilT [Elusimicrobiota bacterium]|nr:type IV pilus twitching motility protein PilT [Elusimicrobiota bacterium]